jgi:phosphatidylserine decarboxylase
MDLSEAQDPVTSFGSLDQLFVRRLRPGVRSWPSWPDVAASPVDGVVGAVGRVEAGSLLQAKGRHYTVAELLDDEEQATRFGAGSFATLYLAPRHYHRIHAPVGGRIEWARHVPGRLLPVNRPAVARIDRLFPRNERLVAVIEPPSPVPEDVDAGAAAESGAESGGVVIETPGGRTGAVAVVAVGAFNVGRITADFDESLVTNRRRSGPDTRVYDPPLAVERGDPLMAFHLGSTVVLLFERPVTLAAAVAGGRDIRLGDPLII